MSVVNCGLYEETKGRNKPMYSVRVYQGNLEILYQYLFSYRQSFMSRKYKRLLNILNLKG